MPPDIPLKDVLDQFSGFLHTKFTTIQNNLDVELLEAPGGIPSVLCIQDSIPGGKLNTFRILKADNVQKLTMKSSTKSCVHNPLPTWLLKTFTEPVLPTMMNIINKSLESCVFPNTLKKGRVTLLLKKSNLDKTVFKNYCPISNLAFLSKILQKAIMHQSIVKTSSSTTFSVPSSQPVIQSTALRHIFLKYSMRFMLLLILGRE